MTATKTSNRQLAINIMLANKGKTSHEVIAAIENGIACDKAMARMYFHNALYYKKADRADYIIGERAAKPKAEKAEKPQKNKKVAAVVEKTDEEIAEIKAKNLKKLKQVAEKKTRNSAKVDPNFDPEAAKQYVQAVTDDLDSFKAPDHLTMEEVAALV